MNYTKESTGCSPSEKKALIDIQKLIKSGKRADIKKLYKFLEELKEDLHSGAGNPEQLKYDLGGYWSRRINKKDPLVYEIIEEPENFVVVVSALGHYI